MTIEEQFGDCLAKISLSGTIKTLNISMKQEEKNMIMDLVPVITLFQEVSGTGHIEVNLLINPDLPDARELIVSSPIETQPELTADQLQKMGRVHRFTRPFVILSKG